MKRKEIEDPEMPKAKFARTEDDNEEMEVDDIQAPSIDESRLSKIGLLNEDSLRFLSLCSNFESQHKELNLTSPETFDSLNPPHETDLHNLDALLACPKDKLSEYLNKLVVIKMNGGIGTTMGLNIPRSALSLAGEKTFLDVIVMQLDYINKEYKVNIPLILMNSLHTHNEVQKQLEKFSNSNVKIYTFVQSCYPRLKQITGDLAPNKPLKDDNIKNWYPPGHGDVFYSFHKSGLLERFVKEGKEYMFVSNMENMGAVIGHTQFKILNYVSSEKVDVLLEVVKRSATDERGGIVAHHPKRNKPFLLQLSQVPTDNLHKLPASKFKYWNTNNIWINLQALHNKLQKQPTGLNLDVSRNIKDGYIQFEIYAGSVISVFDNAQMMIVPKWRLREVKTTANLFLLQSNLFTIKRGFLKHNQKRDELGYKELPIIRFDREHFGNYSQYLKRFRSLPNILELVHLNVAGEVYFGLNVTLKGTVIIVAESGKKIYIPDGAKLENCVMAGELNVLDQ